MTARKHHWAPAFYLRNFSGENEHSGDVLVFDLESRKKFWSSPNNVAAKRDFNRVELVGVAPDAIEASLSGFEGEVNVAIAECQSDRRFRSKESRDLIVNFISLLAVRNPRMREAVQSFQETVDRHILNLLLSNEEVFEAQVAKAKEAGYIRRDIEVPFDRVRNEARSYELKRTIPTEAHLAREFESHDKILQAFANRGWFFLHAPNSAAHFITSDHPVSLSSKQGDRLWFGGFGRRDLDVIFPLTSTIALVGIPDKDDGSFVCSEEQVRDINSITLLSAKRQIYASSADFLLNEEI